MADLAASGVTVSASWTAGAVTGKRHVEKLVKLVLTGQGTTTNKIPASALGLTKIESCSNGVKDDDTKIYPAVPSNDGKNLLLMDVTNATDASRAAPADITATIFITVQGY